jgi:hypothetical protein
VTLETIIGAIDALSCDGVRLGWTVDGNISASVPGAEIKSRSVLRGVTGFGPTVEEALRALWRNLTGISPAEYIVIGAMGADRRAVRWNGVAWKSQHEGPSE